jgi:four helix bundle protein
MVDYGPGTETPTTGRSTSTNTSHEHVARTRRTNTSHEHERSAGDQLERASSSIVLNIGEGAGRFSGPDQARFFVIARGSATECAAVLDVLRVRRLATAAHCLSAPPSWSGSSRC